MFFIPRYLRLSVNIGSSNKVKVVFWTDAIYKFLIYVLIEKRCLIRVHDRLTKSTYVSITLDSFVERRSLLVNIDANIPNLNARSTTKIFRFS